MKHREDKQKRKDRLIKQRQDFLLTFFDEDEGNTHKEINGFVLEKMWNGVKQCWQVAIYTQESWAKRENYTEQNDLSWIK